MICKQNMVATTCTSQYDTKLCSGDKSKMHQHYYFNYDIPSIILVLLLLLFNGCCHPMYATTSDTTTKTTELRLTTAGGGYRAMVTNLGFYNAFQQAGIINIENQTTFFTGISCVSGSAWFVGQVAFSQSFLDMAITNDPTKNVYQFTFDWLSAYQNFIESVELNKKLNIRACKLLSLFGADSFCQLLVYSKFQFGNFISNMFQSTVKIHGDTDMTNTFITPENRVNLFKNTDLMFQASLAPTSKTKNNLLPSIQKKVLTYVGPNNNSKAVFSTLIACQYTVVSGQEPSFRYAIDPTMLPLKTYSGPAPRRFKFDDWKQYGFYGDQRKQTILTKLPSSCTDCSGTTMANPCQTNGIGTFVQVMSAASSFLSDVTSAMPSFFSQKHSNERYTILKSSVSWLRKRLRLCTLEATINALYKRTNFINDLSYCSSWPAKCSRGDVQIIDGGYTDVSSLAMNIGLYHSQNVNITDKVLKVILINSKRIDEPDVNILEYFSTTFNQGVEPGNYIWVPPQGWTIAPYQSVQICKEYLDSPMLNTILTDVANVSYPNWRFVTGVINCTTISNNNFGIKAGQTIQLFVARINSTIPTILISSSDIKMYKETLAKTAQYISTEPELVKRLQAFISS